MLLLGGAARPLQCVLRVRFFPVLSFTQSNGGVPCHRAAGGGSPTRGLPDLAPVTVAILHPAATVGGAQVRWRWGCGWTRLSLAVLSARVGLLLALVVLIVARQPVNGVVRIRSRHPRLQALAGTDHH